MKKELRIIFSLLAGLLLALAGAAGTQAQHEWAGNETGANGRHNHNETVFNDSSSQTDTTDVDDPFKNDPFFNKPFSDFFENRRGNWTEKDDIKKNLASLHKSGLDYNADIQNGPYRTNMIYGAFPVLPMFHFNRVDGLFLGIRQERMQWFDNGWPDIPNLNVHGSIGHSFGRKAWPYSIGVDLMPFGGHRFMIGGEYHQNSLTTDDYWRTGLLENSLTSLFAGYDYMDYYLVDGAGIYTMFRGERLFEVGAAFVSDDYSSIGVQSRYSFFGNKSTYRPNPEVSEGNIQSLYLSGSFNPKELLLAPRVMFKAEGLVELADLDGMDNEYGYNRYLFESRFSSNLAENTVFEWRLRSGSLTGDMPLQRMFELGGIGTLRGRDFKAYTGNTMVLNNFQFYFGSPSYTDGDWIDWDDLRVMFFLDSGWTDMSQKLRDQNNPFEGYGEFSLTNMKHDIGVGIGSSVLRLELAWPTDRLDETPALWFRFNPLML